MSNGTWSPLALISELAAIQRAAPRREAAARVRTIAGSLQNEARPLLSAVGGVDAARTAAARAVGALADAYGRTDTHVTGNLWATALNAAYSWRDAEAGA